MVLLFVVLFLFTIPSAARGRHSLSSSDVLRRAAPYDAAIREAAARYSVDPHLLWTIAYLESGFQPALVSRKGARGLMQFIPSTGRRYGLMTISDLHNPLRSIDAAARFVKDLSEQFRGRTELVLASYNAGEHAVTNANNQVPRYRETRAYVARGLAIFRRLRLGVLDIKYPRVVTTRQVIKRRETPPEVHQKARPTRYIYFAS